MPRLRAEQLKDYSLTNLQIALNAAISQNKIADQTGDPTGWISKGTVHVVDDYPTWNGSQEGQIFYINPTDELLLGTGNSPYYTAIGGNAGFDSKITVKAGSGGSDWNGTTATKFVSDSSFDIDGGNLFVYLNGELQQYSAAGVADYQIVNSTTIQFINPIYVNDKVTLVVYANASLTNYATKAYVDDKFSGSVKLTGDTSVGGNLYPSQTNMYDIGTTDMHWKDLYLQGSVKFLPIGEGDSLKIYRGLQDGTDTQLKMQIGTSAADQIIFEDANQTAIMSIGGDGTVTIPGKLKVVGSVEYMNQSNTETSDAIFYIGVDGSHQVTEITTVADVGGSLGGKYFLLSSPSTNYYVWMDTGSSTDPAPAGYTGIKATISQGATDIQVASAIKNAFTDLGTIFAVNSNNNTVTITNAKTGVSTAASDVGTGFTVTVATTGVNEKDGDASYAVARLSGDAKIHWNETTNRWQAYYGDDGQTISSILTENDLANGINLDARYVKETDMLASGSSATGVLKYTGIYDTNTPDDGVFYSGIIRPSADTRLNYNGILYVKDLHTDNNSIYIGTNKISYNNETNQLTFSDSLSTVALTDANRINGYRVLKYLGSPTEINGASTTDDAAQEFAYFDYVILNTGLELTDSTNYASNVAVMKAAVKINQNLRIFGSIDIGGTTNYSVLEIETQIDKWITFGATDIFLKNSGYDSSVTRNRLNTIIDYIHSKNISAMFDASNPDDVFATTAVDTYNPSATVTKAEKGDLYLFDNYLIDTQLYSGNNGYVDNATFLAKINKVSSYAKSIGILVLANGRIDGGLTDLAEENYWEVFEAMSQATNVAGYGISYGDSTSTSIHKFIYDTEYADFYSIKSAFSTSGDTNNIYTRSRTGRTVTAYLNGSSSYGDLGYKTIKKFEFRKPNAFYNASALPSSTTGSVKFDGNFTSCGIGTSDKVYLYDNSFTGDMSASLTSDRSWELPDESGTMALVRTAGNTGTGALKYNGATPAIGTLYSGITLPSNTSIEINYDGVFAASKILSNSTVRIYSDTSFYHELSGAPTATRSLIMPDESGTVALIRTAGDDGTGSVKYNGTTQASGQFDGGTVNPVGVVRLNYNGSFYATNVYATSLYGALTGSLAGNASTASALSTARTISLIGDASGSVNFDGSADVSITVAIADDSHSHTSAYITDATSANTANMIVKRDASGNFNAGTITANLIGAVTGNASTATTLATARTISLTGDVSGSVSFNGSADVSITATVANDSHSHTSAYITDATSANTANMIVKRGASGEIATGAITATNLTLSGNLTVNGTTTTIDTTTLTIEDNIITLNKNQTGAPASTLTSGIEVERGDSENYDFMFRESDDTFVIGAASSLQAVATRQDNPTANAIPYWNSTALRFDSSNVTVSGSTLTGSLSGNATTATTLATARTISLTGDVTGSVSFNGSADVSITTIVGNDSHSHTSAYITDATSANTANMIVKRDASGNFNAGTITATTFSGALSGNATSATTAGTATNVSGGSMALATGIHTIANSGATSGVFNGIQGTMGDNDQWFIGGSQTASDAGYMEIATGDGGTEPIYVRQYTGIPHTNASTAGTVTRTLTLLDGSGNTAIPGTLSISSAGVLQYGLSAPSGTAVLGYNGYFYATKVYNAVWNDIADFVEVDDSLVVEYGKCYARGKDYKVAKSTSYVQKGILGIASDTYGISAGNDPSKKQIPIAVGGFVLAFTRDLYEPGTALTSDADGYLIEMSDEDRAKYPERMVAIFDRPETDEEWNGIKVNGRNWVKVI